MVKVENYLDVSCDHRIPMKLKETFYRTTIKFAMFYGSKCEKLRNNISRKMSVTEMRMLK